MPKWIVVYPRRGQITDDGNTPLPRGVHGEFVNYFIPPFDHAKTSNESVPGNIDQIPCPQPMNRKDVVRRDSDREDLFDTADGGVQFAVIAIAIVMVLAITIVMCVIIVRIVCGGGEIGPAWDAGRV